MALKWYDYYTEDGQQHRIQVEENVMLLYNDIVKTLTDNVVGPALQPIGADEVGENWDPLPSSIQPRRLMLQIPGFGQAILPILNNNALWTGGGLQGRDFHATIAEHALAVAGDAQNPTLPKVVATAGELFVQCTGYQGERRLSQ